MRKTFRRWLVRRSFRRGVHVFDLCVIQMTALANTIGLAGRFVRSPVSDK